MYRFVVDMFACPAFVITAIGDEPAAASFVIAVCRRSWNGVIGDYEEAARKIQTALLRIQNREGGLGFQ
jgi:hypothetical protein